MKVTVEALGEGVLNQEKLLGGQCVRDREGRDADGEEGGEL